mgnify:CR=1 FL=1
MVKDKLVHGDYRRLMKTLRHTVKESLPIFYNHLSQHIVDNYDTMGNPKEILVPFQPENTMDMTCHFLDRLDLFGIYCTLTPYAVYSVAKNSFTKICFEYKDTLYTMEVDL